MRCKDGARCGVMCACSCVNIHRARMYVGCSGRGVQLELARMFRVRHSVSSDTEFLHAAKRLPTERYSDRCDGLGDIKYDQVLVVFVR